MVRKKLTDKGIQRLVHSGPKRLLVADTVMPNLYVRMTPSGVRSFVVVTRGPAGQKWVTLGKCAHMGIETARARARETIRRIKDGLPAHAPAAESYAAVASLWMQRHVRATGLRSGNEIQRYLTKHILPAWGERPFESIRRGDIVTLLDGIEDGSGVRTADYALTIAGAIARWYAVRHDDYVNPFVPGLRRGKPGKRSRTLSHAEIRAVWSACEGQYGAIVKLLLLTAQRREKVAGMRWSDIEGDVWTVPHDEGEKGAAGALKLPAMALAIIEAQPLIVDHEYVFAGRWSGHFSGWSASKHRLDAASGVTGWVLHDLRRTARSLMGDADVRPEIAERVLGHVVPGGEGIYDRGEYFRQKAAALAALASLVQRILDQQDNVKLLRRT
jgi:integrase